MPHLVEVGSREHDTDGGEGANMWRQLAQCGLGHAPHTNQCPERSEGLRTPRPDFWKT